MNYFEFYELPISFVLDEQLLRSKYIALSRQYHPDFYTTEESLSRQFALDKSVENNKAYITLRDFDQRLHYVLELKGLISNDFKSQQLPNDFLMDMMDINEALMELELDFNENIYQNIKKNIEDQENQLDTILHPLLAAYDDTQDQEEILKKIKNIYLKKRYFLRISEKLSTFATAK